MPVVALCFTLRDLSGKGAGLGGQAAVSDTTRIGSKVDLFEQP